MKKSKELKRITLEEYLDKNCICAPDTERCLSVCGFVCRAKWHWWLEMDRLKVIMGLGYKFNPPALEKIEGKKEGGK